MTQPLPRLDTLSDEDLIARFRTGHPQAFEVVFLRYRDRATGYAWRMLQRREEGEEVALEAFTKIVNGAWQPTGSFKSFLFSVVHRMCIDRLRKRQRVLRLMPRLKAEPRDTRTPEDAAVGKDDLRRLERALAKLPEAQRAPLLLYYRQELPSKQVASIIGCSDQQVRSRLSYARRMLRELMTLDEEAGS